MDHATIEARGLIDRYVRGEMAAEDEAAFEEHFVACGECQAELELERGLGRGVRAVAAEEAARAVVASGLLAWLARRGRPAALGMILAMAALVAIPALWLSSRYRQLEQAAEALRQALTSEKQSAAGMKRELERTEQRHAAERAAFEERLAEAEAAPSPLIARTLEVPVVLLATVRGSGGPATIERRQAARPLALAVDVGAGAAYASYTLTVRDADGKVLLRRPGLHPNALEVLMLTFPAGFFSPGEYRVEVAGVEPGGAEQEVGQYVLRVGGYPAALTP